MTIDLSFTQDPEWRACREQHWDEYEAKERDHFTKKQLSVRKAFFLNAALQDQDNDKLSLADSSLIYMFPLKTPEGWEYVCRELMSGQRRDGGEPDGYYSLLDVLVTNAIDEMGRGWSHEEQCALFDWLLGEHFQAEIKPPVPVGPRGIQPSHSLDPDYFFSIAITRLFFWLKDVAKMRPRPVWASRLEYLMDLFHLIDERFFYVKECDYSSGTKNGIEITDIQYKFQRILEFMKKYPPRKVPEEAVAERQAFLDDFRQRMEALDPKPGQLAELLANLNN